MERLAGNEPDVWRWIFMGEAGGNRHRCRQEELSEFDIRGEDRKAHKQQLH